MHTFLRSLFALAIAFPLVIRAQVVDDTPARTIRTSKAAITALAVAPKGDRLLVGLDKGAELIDLESGRRVYTFPYSEDGGTAVYHVAFNENGEYVVLIGHSGKRAVWSASTGKQDKVITPHRWIPDPRQVKAMGLDMKNSTFDRFYQQTAAAVGAFQATAAVHGAVQFTGEDGKVVQKLEFPTNKDQHHRAPLLVHDGHLLVGTDDGRVLFYPLR